MEDMDELVYLGHVAVFFVPVQKLDSPEYSKDGKTPREVFEDFLMDHYNAFTLEISNTQGLWREHKQAPIWRDENARYEVSFDGEVTPFVQFLSEMCSRLQEQSIYLTMGYKSWLVLPRITS
tara:strand:+ start:596 stop:961 length:366 start_codon:yes stop_codon:yes gene_type:complete